MDSLKKLWKVGELAQATGVTVRTLHHYDEIGLLNASQLTDSGHRLYTHDDIARLQNILTLRQLGLPLEEIASALDRPDFSFLDCVVRLRAEVKKTTEELAELDDRLDGVEKIIRRGEIASVEKMIQLIKVMTMFEKYLSPDQQDKVNDQRLKLGDARMKEAQTNDWPELIAKVQAALNAGTSPRDPAVRQLAEQWMGLVTEFTGGDPKIAQNLRKMWENEPSLPAVSGYPGVDMGKLMNYISLALETRPPK